MKTNKFDETIRGKLEGVQPEFSNEDWSSFRKHYKANVRGEFWKNYAGRVGYGVAASLLVALSAVCGLLYQQNSLLKTEIQGLRDQIIKLSSAEVPRENTTESIEGISLSETVGLAESSKPHTGIEKENLSNIPIQFSKEERNVEATDVLNPLIGISKENALYSEQKAFPVIELSQSKEVESIAKKGTDETSYYRLQPISEIFVEKLGSLETGNISNAIMVTRDRGQNTFNGQVNKLKSKPADVQQAKKEKRVLPTFITDKPYRVGFSGAVTRNMSSIGVVNEFLLHPNIAVTWGITQTTYRQLEFFNEKMFAEKTRQNFRKSFTKGMPVMGEAVNISTYSTLTQIPLFVTYRQPLPAGITLTGSLQTHLNIRFRQNLDYNIWDGHKIRELSGVKYRKVSYPLLNNVSPALGIEKAFDPIVLQGEAFYYFRGRDIPYVNTADGFGGRIKLLYQFGK